MLHSSDNERELRCRASAALNAEALPRVRPERMWSSGGCGELCPVCGRSIEPSEWEFELEFAPTQGGNTAREFHLHLPCFTAWDMARDSEAKRRAVALSGA